MKPVRRIPGPRWTAALAVAVLLAVAWRQPCHAMSGRVLVTDDSRKVGARRIPPTLQLRTDVRWVDGWGYRPVRITATPLAPVIADRTLTIEFLVRRRWSGKYDLRVVKEFDIPAGSGPVDTVLTVPQHSGWNAYRLDVFDNGRHSEELSTSNWIRTPNTNSSYEFPECMPAILFVGAKLPDTSRLAALLPVEAFNQGQSMGVTSSGVVQRPLPNAIAQTPAELPQRWIDYSNVDVVYLSLAQLAGLQKNFPAAFRAVLDWTAAGGNLWVYDAGVDWQGLGRLEELAGLRPGPGTTADDPAERGWTWPNPKHYSAPLRSPVDQESFEPYVGDTTGAAIPRRQSSGRPRGSADKAHFVFREYDAGLILAFADDEPFSCDSAEWRGVLNTMGTHRWVWRQRHGVSMKDENPDYLSFLIPDVGLAPVVEFCVLITLFVLAIGPLNYWLLRRCGRLHLLVITIPAGAATVTILLFAYALIADGLGTRTRVRSVTYLDQGRRHAVCWARLSYYCGLSPRGGLRFPEDVVVLPLERLPPHEHEEGVPRRTLAWEDQQRFASGWLTSRTPRQYLTLRSRQSNLGVDLLADGGASSPPKVTNRLDAPIVQLLVCAADGDCYWAEGVDAGSTAAVEPIEMSGGRERLAQTLHENRPAMPPGMTNQSYGGLFGLSRRRFRWRGGNVSPPTQRTGRMEQSLARLASSSSRTAPLEPGGYIAVVERSAEVVLGVRGAEEEASYHVIFGRW